MPDSLLGSAWPVMVSEFAVPLSYAGIVSTIVSAGTIVSSLMSDKLTKKLSAGTVTAVSVLITAVALLGFSVSKSFLWLCIFAVPYGLGAGAIDAALNNFVALHFSSRHMNWLHCFWGLGATISPYIMGWAIGTKNGWRMGYGTIFVIQAILTFVFFISLPVWKNFNKKTEDVEKNEISVGVVGALKIKGVKEILIAFFMYCAFEATVILWASSYLVEQRGVDVKTAATFASLYCFGITVGRFLCGFISDRIGDKGMIRLGNTILIMGTVFVILPIKNPTFVLVGFIITGIGSAPVYPSIIHSTPVHFGKENSQAIVGIQMAAAYCGSTVMPPVFGFIAENISLALLPFFMIVLALLLLIMTERVNMLCKE